jgi:hypothetical protein
MSTHAKLSPSGAERWMLCAGSVALEADLPDEDSEYSKEGTAAHEMAQLVLDSGAADVEKYIGRRASNGVEMTEDMANNVMTYVSRVRDYAQGFELMIEQRLSIEHLTDEADAKGTSDAVILTPDELQVHDLKYGRGVRKDAENNKQLMIYALAALREFEMLGNFKRVRLVIHQPRLEHLSEWDCTVEELQAFAQQVTARAEICRSAVSYFEKYSELHEKYLAPGEDQCRFCKAKATCPSLRSFVMSRVTGDDFVDLTQPLAPVVEEHIKDEVTDNGLLANLLGAIDLIESWCKAIRGKADGELRAGREVPGYKLVQGRKGARAWSSKDEVEAIMKSMRLKVNEMYTMSLISPTQAEALLKEKPKCWKRVAPFISQSEGGLSVAPVSDKRPAVMIKVEEFNDEEALEGLV